MLPAHLDLAGGELTHTEAKQLFLRLQHPRIQTWTSFASTFDARLSPQDWRVLIDAIDFVLEKKGDSFAVWIVAAYRRMQSDLRQMELPMMVLEAELAADSGKCRES